MSDNTPPSPRRLGAFATIAFAGLVTLVPTQSPSVASAAPTDPVALAPMPEVSGPVYDVPAGGALPSDATCAARVQRVAESRPENASYNQTRGSSPNNENPRVTGNFVGTTDEIIQWAACKWGLDPSWARAQALVESYWIQSTVSDFGSDGCLPGHPIGADGRPGQCPQSVGLLQVRYPFHQDAFEDNNAIRSTAYNADYAWSIWRRCFNGEYTWLNTVERGRDYAAGDGLGCIGLWFAGRWYTDAAVGYMNRVGDTSVPTPQPATPSATRSLTATAGVGSGQVRLNWTAPASTGGSAITDYLIQRSWDGGRTWTSISDGLNVNRTFVVSGNKNGARYSFRVAARNSAGWGPYSNVASAIPRAPSSLDAVGTSSVGPESTTSTVPPTTEPPTTAPLEPTTTTDAPAPSVGSIGDFVWTDANGDGQQDTTESGVAAATVRLLDGSDTPVATTLTDEHGAYEFTGVVAGAYRIEVDLPDGLTITAANVGADDELDSDAIEADQLERTARTDRFDVAGTTAEGIDIGLAPDPAAAATTTTTPPVTLAPSTVAATTTTSSTVPLTTVPTTTIPEPTTTMAATTTVAAGPTSSSTTLAPS